MVLAMDEYETVSVRLPMSMARELDEQIEALAGEQRGITWNRSNVIRTALVTFFRSEAARREVAG